MKLIFAVVGLDLGLKLWVVRSGFPFTLNPGRLWLSVLALLLVISMWQKKRHLGLELMIGGGLANLIDRVVSGGVVDFIDFPFWPSFNLADVAISLGLGLIILSWIREWFTRTSIS